MTMIVLTYKISDQPTFSDSLSIIYATNALEISWEQLSYENCAANATRNCYRS